MTFKAKKITNDKTGYDFKFEQEDSYNNERPDQTEKWGASEPANADQRPSKDKGGPSIGDC